MFLVSIGGHYLTSSSQTCTRSWQVAIPSANVHLTSHRTPSVVSPISARSVSRSECSVHSPLPKPKLLHELLHLRWFVGLSRRSRLRGLRKYLIRICHSPEYIGITWYFAEVCCCNIHVLTPSRQSYHKIIDTACRIWSNVINFGTL